MILAFGALFFGMFLSTALRYYKYIKTGSLLTGEVIGYDYGPRASVRSVVFFEYDGTSLILPTYQTYSSSFLFNFYPKKKSKVRVYYTEQYKDYVLLAGSPQIVLNLIIMLLGLAFIIFGLLGLLGFIPTK